MVYTDDYSHAAQAEANGFNALTHQVFASGSLALCDLGGDGVGGAPADGSSRTVRK